MANEVRKTLLYFSVASGTLNILPIVPVALFMVLIYAILDILRQMRIRWLCGPAKWFVLYAFLSLVYCASIGIDILDLSLYRRELKYLFPFLGFILFSSISYPNDLSKTIRRILVFAVFGSGIFCFMSVFLRNVDLPLLYGETVLTLYGGGALIGKNMWEQYTEDQFVYIGQFLSHSAAGGFLATVGLILFGFFQADKSKTKNGLILFSSFLLVLFLLYIVKSRAFMLATAIVLLSIAISRLASNKFQRNLVLSCIVIFALILGSPFYQNIIMPDFTTPVNEQLSTPRYNVAVRFFLWAKAADDFLQSPLIGVGISRFDDVTSVLATLTSPAEDFEPLKGAPADPNYYRAPWVRINTDRFQAHTDQHAHNVYLHILAEGGILFFLLTAIAYGSAIKRVNDCQKIASNHERRLAKGVLYAFCGVFIASFFGNNLHSIIPMFMLLSISGYLSSRYRAISSTGEWKPSRIESTSPSVAR